MQKKLIALAISGLASTGVLAQSNVTVYGILDAYYSYNSIDTRGLVGAKPSTKHLDSSGHDIGSGGLSGSRLGFRGMEDLGNGLKANFVLEYAVQNDVNTGLGLDSVNNQTRQASIGLSGNWGSVNIGRLQSAAYDWDCTTAPLAGSGLDAKAKLAGHALLSCGGGGRVNNAVAYNSPNFSGFTFAVNHTRITENQNGISPIAVTAPAAAAGAPAAVPAANSNVVDNDAYANIIGGGYNNGPLSVNAVWSKIDNSVKNNGTGFATEEVTEWGISGSYNFGMLKLFGAYQAADFDVKSTTVNRGTDNKKWTIGVGVPVGANGSVAVQYADASLDKCTGTIAAATTGAAGTINQFNQGCDSDAWTIAYTHNLSKRTTLYAGYVNVSNERNSANNAAMTGGKWKTDVGGDASTFVTGARHSF